MVLSTLRVHDELVAAGMPEARAVVRVIERQQAELATKKDLELQTAQLQALFWRGVALVCGVIVAGGGAIIGAIGSLHVGRASIWAWRASVV